MNKLLKESKGNALLTAIVAFCVLIIIGMSVAALSLTNVTVSVKTKQYNNTYYVAEAAVQKGIQHVKDSIGQYYKEMQDIASSSGYCEEFRAKYDNFFDNIISNASSTFVEPSFTESTLQGAQTSTEFSVENENTVTRVADIVVKSTATLPDGNTRTVQGIMSIPKINILVRSDSWYDPTVRALTVGNNMAFRKNFNDQVTIVDGDAAFGGIENKKTPFTQVVMVNGAYSVVPGTGNTIYNSMKYSQLLQRRITPSNVYITSANGPTDQDALLDPCYIEGAPELSYGIKQLSITGQAYSRADMTVMQSTFIGDIFCNGDLNIVHSYISGNIFCAGNITITDSTIAGEYLGNSTVNGGIYAGGSISLERAATNNCIVYANTDLYVKSSTITGVTFTGNNTEIHTDLTFSGAMTVKKDFRFDNNGNRYFTLNYKPNLVNAIRNNELYAAFFSNTEYNMVDINPDDTILNQQIYEE